LLLKPRAPSAATEGAGGYSAWITRPSSAMSVTIGPQVARLDNEGVALIKGFLVFEIVVDPDPSRLGERSDQGDGAVEHQLYIGGPRHPSVFIFPCS
jgi:hypothetical protein